MGKIKRGRQLAQMTWLKKNDASRLRRLGITTIEELHDFVGESLWPDSLVDAAAYLEREEGDDRLFSLLAEGIPKPQATLVEVMQARGAPARANLMPKVGFDPACRGFVSKLAMGALPPHRRLLIHTVQPPEARGRRARPQKARLPKAVNLQKRFHPIRNQGERGTCVAHTGVALMEHYWKRAQGKNIDFSEQFLYWSCKQQDNAPNESGTYQRVAVALLVNEGVCPEQTWRYTPAPEPYNESQGPPPRHPAEVTEAVRYRPARGTAIDPQSVEAIRSELAGGRPVGISVPVFPSWWGQTPHLYGQIPIPRPGEQPEGGHAVCLVGYGEDDDFAGGGFFIVRNSWGTAWAPKSPFGAGYGTLPFAYVGKHTWEAFVLSASLKAGTRGRR